ncbi:MAG TPA: RluA family pseudouridine synthase [bacterium]|nr:RluA family pseudouridine synthase [bacterium]
MGRRRPSRVGRGRSSGAAAAPAAGANSALHRFETAVPDDGRRLDVVVAARVPSLSRSRIARLADAGDVRVDGHPRKPAFRLRPGQSVEIAVPPPEPSGVRPEAIPLDIVLEDQDLLVVNKPAGLTVHPAPGHPSGTLVNALLSAVRDLAGIGGALRPGIVHRLDKDTSGLLVVAKSDAAHRALAAQFKAHTAQRTYLAVVRGVPRRDSGTIRAPLGRHAVRRTRIAVVPHGRDAVTHYTVLERFRDAALLACRLETGRTHQIRVHLAHAGHPLFGDPVYGRARAPEIARQALHAARLEFMHPRTGRLVACSAPLPDDMVRLLERLRRESPPNGRDDAGGANVRRGTYGNAPDPAEAGDASSRSEP